MSLILDFLADGVSEVEILKIHPQLQADDIRACLAYAAEIARERIIQVVARPAA